MTTADADAPDPPVLLEERRGPVLLLTLNRPGRLNAVSAAMYALLVEALTVARDDAGVRSVVVTGAGRAFCVGADLRAHGDAPATPEMRRAYVESAQAANRLLQVLSKPVVAAVNGHAVGAGLELALSCDVVVVAADARLRLPEAALGTFVGGGVTYRLPARVGDLKARELLLLCPFVLGSEAVGLGLANRAEDAERVLPEALRLAEELARRAPASTARLKALLHEAPTLPRDEVLRREADALLACMDTRDWREGVDAFAEKREPRFTGE